MNAATSLRLALACLLLAPTVAAPARAAEPDIDGSLSAPVSLAGLDLDRPADVQVLYQRIRTRSHALCASIDRKSVATRLGTRRDCEAEAVSRSVAQLDLPLMNALHRQSLDRATVARKQQR